MDSFRFLSYNQYQEMSEMSNSRISIFWATLRHGLQMLGLLCAATGCRPGIPPAGFPGNQYRPVIPARRAADGLITRGYGYGVLRR